MLSTEPCTECQVSIETRLGLQSQTPVSYLSLSKSFAYFLKIFFVKKYYGWKKSKVEKILVKRNLWGKKFVVGKKFW